MTVRDDIRQMLMWLKHKEWYGFDEVKGYFLKPGAPSDVRESFLKWAKYQDEQDEDDRYDYVLP